MPCRIAKVSMVNGLKRSSSHRHNWQIYQSRSGLVVINKACTGNIEHRYGRFGDLLETGWKSRTKKEIANMCWVATNYDRWKTVEKYKLCHWFFLREYKVYFCLFYKWKTWNNGSTVGQMRIYSLLFILLIAWWCDYLWRQVTKIPIRGKEVWARKSLIRSAMLG